MGFKWFAPGLLHGSYCFGGERAPPGRTACSTTAAYGPPTRTGRSWTLLAAEITARTGKGPGEPCDAVTADAQIDASATPKQKASVEKLSPEAVKAPTLAGESIIAKLTRAPGVQRLAIRL